MHLNKQLLLGRVGRKGAELRYNANALVVETDKAGPNGQVYTSFHKVDITGRVAEGLSITLEPGDEILIEGEHHYRSTVDPKTRQKNTTCVLSTWGVSQHLRARVAVERVGGTRDPGLVGLVGKIIVRSARAGDSLRQPEQLRR